MKEFEEWKEEESGGEIYGFVNLKCGEMQSDLGEWAT